MRGMVVGAVSLLVAAAAGAAAQEVQAGPVTLDFTGRAQVQLNTTSLGDEELGAGSGPAEAAFETRRMRFGTGFAYEDWITGVIEVDFGGATAALTDAFIDLALAESFAVSAGQQKKPFGLFELTSNTKILTIERTARIRALDDYLGREPADAHTLLDESGYLGRDIGVVVHGAAGRIGYAAGIFNGSGPNTREDLGSKAYAARVAIDVTDALVVGVAASRQPFAAPGLGSAEGVGTAWALDAELGGFRQPGLHVMAELMGGDDPAVAGAGEVPEMLGAQAVAGWFLARAGRVEGVEPVLRLSWGDPDTGAEADEGLLVTPGVNLYFTGRNRLMLNGDVYVPAQEGLEAQYALVAQLQIYF